MIVLSRNSFLFRANKLGISRARELRYKSFLNWNFPYRSHSNIHEPASGLYYQTYPRTSTVLYLYHIFPSPKFPGPVPPANQSVPGRTRMPPFRELTCTTRLRWNDLCQVIVISAQGKVLNFLLSYANG